MTVVPKSCSLCLGGHFLLVTLGAFVVAFTATAGQPAVWTPRGPGGGGALFVPSFSPNNANELYISSDMSELFHTTNLGASAWTVVDFTQIVGGRAARVAFTSNPQIAYCITTSPDSGTGSLCQTSDGGTTWPALATDPTAGNGAYSVYTDIHSTNNILVSSYTTLYFSGNGGTSFNAVYTQSAGLFIAGAFMNGADIYVGTNFGLLVSTNNGASFALSTATGLSTQIASLTGACDPNGTRLFCITVPSGNLYPGLTVEDLFGVATSVYTLNVGQNWVACNLGLNSGDSVNFIGSAGNDTSVAYASGQAGATGNPIVYKTADSGVHWALCLLVQNNQNTVTGYEGYQGDLNWSWGGGSTGFAVSPVDSSKAAWTDDGFCHLTSDGGTSWVQAYTSPAGEHPAGAPTPKGCSYQSVGLEQTSVWSLAWADANHVFAGYTDIRGARSTDAGASWSFNYTGQTLNTMYCVIAHPNGNLYAGTSSIHDLYQSTHLTNTSIDSGNGNVVFSADQGATWTTMFSAGHPVIWVAADPNNPTWLYASVVHSSAGGIFVSKNINLGAGATWTQLANPPRTEGHPFNIVVLKDGTLVCSYSGHRNPGFTASSGVFLSTDGGNTWADRTAPSMEYWVQDVVVDPNDATQNTWYAGVYSGWGGNGNNDGGLYQTTNRGVSWTRLLTNDGVTSCAFNPSGPDEMFVTTEDAGLWYASNASTGSPTFSRVTTYPFEQPERIFFNPYNNNEVWLTSFGNGLRVGESGPAASPVLTTISVTPNPVTVTAGAAQAFTATGLDQTGTALSAQPAFTWSVSSGGGAISGTGLLSASTTAGNYSVSAASGSVAGTANFTVSVLTTITVSPSEISLPLAGTQQFTAVAQDQAGNLLTPVLTWSVTAGGGSVDATGFYTAPDVAGTYTISVSSGTVSGTAIVNVSGGGGGGGGGVPPLALQLTRITASLKFSGGRGDKCQISGVIPNFPAAFSPSGVPVTVNISGAAVTFSLNAKGQAQNPPSSFALKLKRGPRGTEAAYLGGTVPFSATLTGDWVSQWAGLGINPQATQSKLPITVDVQLTIGSSAYAGTIDASYSAKAGKTGSFRGSDKRRLATPLRPPVLSSTGFY